MINLLSIFNFILDIDDDFDDIFEGTFDITQGIFSFIFVLAVVIIIASVIKKVIRRKKKTKLSSHQTLPTNTNHNPAPKKEEMFCEYCGGMIPENKSECPYCGAKRTKK